MPTLSATAVFSNVRKSPLATSARLAVCLCLSLAVSGEVRGQADYPFKPGAAGMDLVAYYYPVPDDSVVVLLNGSTFRFHSLLHVYGAVPGGRFEVAVEGRHEDVALFSRTFAIDSANPPDGFTYEATNGYFRIESQMEALPAKPTHISVAVIHESSRRTRTVECRYHTISGTIRDIDDKPLRAFLSVGPDDFASPISVWSDAGGHFSIDLPERTYNVFYVDDHTYAVSTLEMWGWHMIVDRDEDFDFVVGNGEVYNLHAWPNDGGYGTYFVFFRPMVLPLAEEATPSVQAIGQREFEVTNYTPKLTATDLIVRINGVCADIVSVQEVYETGISDNVPSAMPAYLVQIERKGTSVTGKVSLSLEYDASVSVKGQSVRVRSVGHTQFYNGFSGYSVF